MRCRRGSSPPGWLGSIEAGKAFPDPRVFVVYLFWLNIDHFGVPRAHATQFLAYRFRLVLVVEKPPPLVIGRPPAMAAIVPPGDRRIYSGSKRDGVGHCALLVSEGCRCVHTLAKHRFGPIVGIEPQKRHTPFRNWGGFSESFTHRRSGGCCCGFSTLNGLGERGVKCSFSPFGAVLECERKVAHKPTYFRAVVVM
jgi:hypothetical protein